MKLKVSLIVDIPDNMLLMGEHQLLSAKQFIHDTIINYANTKHLEDALKWLSEAEKLKNIKNKDIMMKIYEFHRELSKIISKSEWDCEDNFKL